MEKHSRLYVWFWYRPLFRSLRLRIMTMVLALVLPLSLISITLSVISINRSMQSTYELGNNGFQFYLDGIALRRTAEGHGGMVYVTVDGEQAYLIHRDSSWEAVSTPFSSLRSNGQCFLWEKKPELFQVLVVFPYNFALAHVPVWYWIALGISALTLLLCPLLYARLRHDVLTPMQTMEEALDAFREDRAYRIPPQSMNNSDEFLRLFADFNAMAGEVQASHQKDVKLLETEMDNLRLQVNPHMLLNSYNMIYALAQSKNYVTIQDYALCLADYFRYVLRRGQLLYLYLPGGGGLPERPDPAAPDRKLCGECHQIRAETGGADRNRGFPAHGSRGFGRKSAAYLRDGYGQRYPAGGARKPEEARALH